MYFSLETSRSTHRAFLITISLTTAAILQGLPVLQVYSEPLFAEAVPNMSANLCSILFAVISIIFGFAAAYLSDFAGRRVSIMSMSLNITPTYSKQDSRSVSEYIPSSSR
jgi:hypothetical protein